MADQGKTAYVGIIEKQVTSATDLSTPDTSEGNYSASSVVPAMFNATDRDKGPTSSNQESSSGLPVPTGGGGGTTITYKLRAKDTGASYVEWTTTTTPLTTGSYPGSPVGTLVDLTVLSQH